MDGRMEGRAPVADVAQPRLTLFNGNRDRGAVSIIAPQRAQTDILA